MSTTADNTAIDTTDSTTRTATPSTRTTFRYQAGAPELFQRLFAVEAEITSSSLDPLLRHLVKLRVSQINQCAFCVNMHLGEARADGESNERLDKLIVWRHVSAFSPAERAALAWAEALTELDPKADLEPLRRELRAQFDDSQIANLTSAVGMINLWNRIQVSLH